MVFIDYIYINYMDISLVFFFRHINIMDTLNGVSMTALLKPTCQGCKEVREHFTRFAISNWQFISLFGENNSTYINYIIIIIIIIFKLNMAILVL